MVVKAALAGRMDEKVSHLPSNGQKKSYVKALVKTTVWHIAKPGVNPTAQKGGLRGTSSAAPKNLAWKEFGENK